MSVGGDHLICGKHGAKRYSDVSKKWVCDECELGRD